MIKPTGGSAGLWNYRNFRLLLGARLADTAGNAIAPIALGFAVLDLTGSVTSIGFVVGARSVGMLGLLLFGGILGDRLSRSAVLVWSNMVSAVTQATIASLVLTGTATVPVLIVLSFVNGGASAISFPAARTLVTETIPKSLLPRANATLGSGVNFMSLIGLVIGVALVVVVGPGWGLAIDAASFAITALLFGLLKLPNRAIGNGSSMLQDLRVGWDAFAANSWVWVTVIGFLVINAVYVGSIYVLGPAVADDTIGRARWGWVLSAHAVGLLVVTVTLARWNLPHRLAFAVAVSGLIAPFIFLLGASPQTVPMMVAAFFGGMGFAYMATAWDSTLQANIADEHLSRVYSIDMMGSVLAFPAGYMTIGPISEAIGRRSTLVAAAALVVLAAISVLAVPSVRKLPGITAS